MKDTESRSIPRITADFNDMTQDRRVRLGNCAQASIAKNSPIFEGQVIELVDFQDEERLLLAMATVERDNFGKLVARPLEWPPREEPVERCCPDEPVNERICKCGHPESRHGIARGCEKLVMVPGPSGNNEREPCECPRFVSIEKENEPDPFPLQPDMVNHPPHYAKLNPEPITVIEDWGLDFFTGNAVKYVARAGRKDPTKQKEDLEKAIWYLKRKVERL